VEGRIECAPRDEAGSADPEVTHVVPCRSSWGLAFGLNGHSL
jgi:hypothetical protein